MRTQALKLFALLLAGGLATYLVMRLPQDPPSKGSDAGAGKASSPQAVSKPPASAGRADAGAVTSGAGQLTPRPAQANDPNDLASFHVPGQPAPTMQEVIEELHKAGIHSGLGAFPPPGTSPPLVGIAVPDDYVLPEGYVRHFQATDDGQRIEPILMYSPDYEFFDAAGRRIEIPADRVVPPELAPPGLPLRPIEIPPPLESGSAPV
jgi:hypothetical protein